MPDSPSSSASSDGSDGSAPGSTVSPTTAGLALYRESVLATVGVLALFAGLNGWLSVLDGILRGWGYTAFDLAKDVAFVLLGTYLLVAAAGSATRRLRRS